MNPVHHARSAAARHGGDWRRFVAVHAFYDQSKAVFAGVQHRLFVHTADVGGDLARRAFGAEVIPGVATDLMTHQHLDEDLGAQVTLEDWLKYADPTLEAKLNQSRVPLEARYKGLESDPTGRAAAVWGGVPGDYAPLTELLALPERHSRHPLARWVLRNTLGIFIAEACLGPAIETADGRIVPTRLVAEKMVHAATGQIVPATRLALAIRQMPWMRGVNANEPDLERLAA